MNQKEKREFYIAMCSCCLIAEAMKTCSLCRFEIGLVEKDTLVESISIPIPAQIPIHAMSDYMNSAALPERINCVSDRTAQKITSDGMAALLAQDSKLKPTAWKTRPLLPEGSDVHHTAVDRFDSSYKQLFKGALCPTHPIDQAGM